MRRSRLDVFAYPIAAIGLILWGLGLFGSPGTIPDGVEVSGYVMTFCSLALFLAGSAIARRRNQRSN